MRRLLLLALSASTIAAFIPVAFAQTGPDITEDVTASLAAPDLREVAIRREARAQMRAAARRAKAKKAASATVAIPPHLAAIAQCESGMNPRAIGGGGLYRGMFQFHTSTWAAVGGTGDPAAASVAEQVKRAQILYERSGPGQWPVCGS